MTYMKREAEAEANRLWPKGWPNRTMMIAAFVAGAVWAAPRKVRTREDGHDGQHVAHLQRGMPLTAWTDASTDSENGSAAHNCADHDTWPCSAVNAARTDRPIRPEEETR